MDLIALISHDKISLNMFSDFLKFMLGKSYPIIGMHYLMTQESIEIATKDFIGKNSGKGIICYYSRKNKKDSDPILLVPKAVSEPSDVVIWFDIVSVDPVVLKGSSDVLDGYIKRWKINVEKLSR